MKKICFVTTVSITMKAFILEIAKSIHGNSDWDITFICNPDEEFEKSLPEYIHFIPVPMERGISLAGVKAMLQMKKIFKEQKFDLIQYSTPNASLYASIAGKLAKVPVRLYCQWGMVFVGFQGFKRKIFEIEEKYVCKNSTWIEPDSFGNLNFARSEGLYSKNKSSVIWNGSAIGINFEKFDILKKSEYKNSIREQYNIPSNAFVYGFVGRINRDKGINELLEAFKSIVQNENNAYLMLVGNEEIDENINSSLLSWSKDSKNVIYTGQTNVVEQYLSAMDIYVLPSYREGFGMGVIEAEAMGVPVIVSDIPGPRDAMQKEITGLIVEKANVESLTKAMIELKDNQSLYNELAGNCHKFVEDNFEQKKLFEYILEDRKRLLGE